MKKFYIWHNTRGVADEYWFVNKKTDKVLFYIPRWIGRLFKRR